MADRKPNAGRKESPDQKHSPVVYKALRTRVLALAKDRGIARMKIEFEFSVRFDGVIPRGKGVVKIKSLTPSSVKPEEILANVPAQFLDWATAVALDSGASGVRITGDFTYDPDFPALRKGALHTRIFVTPDAKTERMLDPNVSMPRGSMLHRDADKAMRRVMRTMHGNFLRGSVV